MIIVRYGVGADVETIQMWKLNQRSKCTFCAVFRAAEKKGAQNFAHERENLFVVNFGKVQVA